MDRDFCIFPDDNTGDALWNMAMNGDDISRKRDVEFTVIFATEEEALKFGEALLFNRQQVLLCDNEDSEEYPYEIMATVAMIPTHKEITDYENLLQEHASVFNGLNDGWGSFAG
jgi:hypothetical protein